MMGYGYCDMGLSNMVWCHRESERDAVRRNVRTPVDKYEKVQIGCASLAVRRGSMQGVCDYESGAFV